MPSSAENPLQIILVDWDFKPEDLDILASVVAKRMKAITDILGFSFVVQDVYETEKGYHAVIKIFPEALHEAEIIALQLMLASDPMRELNNWKRIRGKFLGEDIPKHWNVLFMKKERKTEKAKYLEEKINQIYEELMLSEVLLDG